MRVVMPMTSQAICIRRPNDIRTWTLMVAMASRARRHILGFRRGMMHGRVVTLEARLIERLPLIGMATQQAH
jgi:hypothetical protein